MPSHSSSSSITLSTNTSHSPLQKLESRKPSPILIEDDGKGKRLRRKENQDIFSKHHVPASPVPSTSNRPEDEDERPAKRLRALEEAPPNQNKNTNGEEDRNPWSEEDHRSFISAIFDIGLKNSSPATIASHMKSRPPELTSERLKSRLQKFRQHRKKEKEKFLGEFDEFIETMKGQLRRGYPPTKMKKLFGGAAVGMLSLSVQDKGFPCVGQNNLGDILKGCHQRVASTPGPSELEMPQLTEAEQKSPLGLSLKMVMSLMTNMEKHLKEGRDGRTKSLRPEVDYGRTVQRQTSNCMPTPHVPHLQEYQEQFPLLTRKYLPQRNSPRNPSRNEDSKYNGEAYAVPTFQYETTLDALQNKSTSSNWIDPIKSSIIGSKGISGALHAAHIGGKGSLLDEINTSTYTPGFGFGRISHPRCHEDADHARLSSKEEEPLPASFIYPDQPMANSCSMKSTSSVGNPVPSQGQEKTACVSSEEWCSERKYEEDNEFGNFSPI